MKLCAYTICKNESQFVDTWVQGLQNEVDYICVLDTGSTDDTLEKFKKYPNVIVGQKIITPWRFDTARNEAKKLIPEDTDVAMTVDMDEVYNPGFREHIEKAFNEGYNLISGYKILFENGQQVSALGGELSLPIVADYKSWEWEYPVHEYLRYYDETKVKEIVIPEIVCNHHPDFSKSRRQYLDILKRWYESSYPPSAICVEKYTIELYSRGHQEESYQVLKDSIDICTNTNTYTGKITLYRNAFNMAIFYKEHGVNDKIKKYLEIAKSTGIITRSILAYEADVDINIFQDYEAAVSACLQALEITDANPKPYIETAELFSNGNIEDLLAFAYYKLKKYDDAYAYAKKAYSASPYDEKRKENLAHYKRLSENKICVYTICRNESKFVEKWVTNNKDADHLVALVHDCTDDTREKLESLGVDVGYGFYKEWRFDNGKNDSMHLAYALAPECNIFVFTSLDEYWDDGWAEQVKENWIPGETKQCWYNFVQSHDEFGHETGTSYFNWMISKDPKWHWEYPIHEAIIYGESEPVSCINLFNTVKLQHWPDQGKPRDYLDLHKLRWEEYKDDISYLYLVREHIIRNKLQEAYDLAVKFDHEHTNLCPEENAYIWTMQGICGEYLNKFEESLECYRKAYALDNNLRTPLVRSGVIYAKCGCYLKAEELLNKAFNETHKTNSWLEDPWDWRSKPYFWLARIKLKINKEEEALGYALFASQIDSTEEMLNFYQEVLEKCNGK